MDNAVVHEILRAETDWGRAMVADDADAIGRFMADEWTIADTDGKVFDRATFLDLVRSGTVTHDVMDFKEASVRVYGEAAVFIARGISGGLYKGQKFHVTERVTDVWVRRDGAWRCVHTHLSRIEPAD